MINKGQFRDTENNLYEVTITSEIGGSVKIELEFGDTPFTSSLEGNDFLYKYSRVKGSKLLTPLVNTI